MRPSSTLTMTTHLSVLAGTVWGGGAGQKGPPPGDQSSDTTHLVGVGCVAGEAVQLGHNADQDISIHNTRNFRKPYCMGTSSFQKPFCDCATAS